MRTDAMMDAYLRHDSEECRGSQMVPLLVSEPDLLVLGTLVCLVML